MFNFRWPPPISGGCKGRGMGVVYVTLQQTAYYAEKWKMLQSTFGWFRYQLVKSASARCPQLSNLTKDIFRP